MISVTCEEEVAGAGELAKGSRAHVQDQSRGDGLSRDGCQGPCLLGGGSGQLSLQL